MNSKSIIPDFLEPLVAKAVKLLDPSKIILFGSFARGDYKDKSDIDIAFKFDQRKQKEWTILKDWIRDEIQTLREFDLVNIDEADQNMQESISKEGKTLYEQ